MNKIKIDRVLFLLIINICLFYILYNSIFSIFSLLPLYVLGETAIAIFEILEEEDDE